MTLAELLATNPSWPGGLTDAQALAWLREDVTTYQDVPWLALALWMLDQGIERADLEAAASNVGATAANRIAAQHVLDCITAGQPLSASNSDVRSLVQASALSGAAKMALVALAQVSVERWQDAGVAEPTIRAIAEVRNA